MIAGLLKTGVKNLTCVSNNAGSVGAITFHSVIYLRSAILGRVTAAAFGANYCKSVTVPPPMRDRPPHWGLRPIHYSLQTEVICAKVLRGAYGLLSSSEKTRN